MVDLARAEEVVKNSTIQWLKLSPCTTSKCADLNYHLCLDILIAEGLDNPTH